jgi:hypothetical protein
MYWKIRTGYCRIRPGYWEKRWMMRGNLPYTLINYPEGQHNFVVWKYGLYSFAQLIFK